MTDNDLLARQRIINEADKNFLVEASAGSGKTTSLVDRMVALVESGVNISEIVAITFTKKAANEFYERFYKRLYERSKETYTPKIHDLLRSPDSKTREYDKQALKNIDLCFLGTIDSFCNRVLKEHPFEANIPSSSDIVTDREDLIPYIDDVLDELRANKNPLMELIDSIHFKDNIYKLVFYGLEKREYQFSFDKSDSNNFIERQNQFKSLLVDIKNIIDFINDLDPQFLTSDKSKTIYKTIKNEYLRLMAVEYDNYKELKIIKRLKLKDFSYCDKQQEIHIPGIISKYFVLPSGKTRNTKINEDEINKFISAYEYFIYIKSLDFIELIRPILYKIFKDKGLLQFVDNLIYLNNLLSDPIKGQKALSNIRKKYKYYLIDEFQDTSPLQIELFFRLSSDEYNIDWTKIVPNKGSIFMVGDPKQSIYRFKAADFETYSNVKERIINNKEIGEVIYLTRNYRSCKSLVDYFNEIFPAYLKEVKNMQSQFEKIPDNETRIGDPTSGVYLYSQDNSKDDPLFIANLVKKLKDESNGTLKYSDFMIIPQSKSSVGLYKDALARLSIPSFAEGDFKYKGKLFTAVITSFKYLLTHNELSAIELLTSSLFNIDITKLDRVDLLDTQIKTVLPSLASLTDVTPSILFEHLINNDYIISHSGLEGLDLLIFILNILKDEENKGKIKSNNDAIKLINKIIYEGDEERVPLLTNDLDVVRIANVHKVKGLQAKIVILASNAGRGSNRSPDFYINHKTNEETVFKISGDKLNTELIANKDQEIQELLELEKKYSEEENKRLMYVAATRAEDQLIISVNKYSKWSDLRYDRAQTIDSSNINILQEYRNSTEVIDPKDLLNVSLINEENRNLINPTYKIISPSDVKSISIKEAEEEAKIIKNNNDSAIKGTLVHKLLECIVKSKTNKLDKNRCLEIVNEYQVPQYLSLLEQVYETIYSGGYNQINGCKDDILKEIQTSEAYYEVPFSYKKDNDIVFGYIDLILIKDNKYTIIDYKTDKNITTDHSHQLEEYKKALKSTLGVDSNAYIYNININ